MIHLANKSDFIPNTLQISAGIPVDLAKSEDCDFTCIKLARHPESFSQS